MPERPKPSAGGIVYIALTARQWDIVREALYRRETKAATQLAQRIWDQGGGTGAWKDPDA